MHRNPIDEALSNLRSTAYGRIRPARVVLQALALLLATLLAAPPKVRADDAKCLDATTKNYGKLVKAWTKHIAECIAAGDAASPASTAEACVALDGKGRIAKAVQKLVAEAVGGSKDKCEGTTPAFGYTDAATNIVAAEDLALGLAHQIFGDPLDLKAAGGDADLALCRKILWDGASKIVNAGQKELRRCLKDAVKGGATSNDDLIAACFATGLPDPKGKVAKQDQKLQDKLAAAGCTSGPFLRSGGGARPTAVEYAVMLALIIVVVIAAITLLGQNANRTFGSLGSSESLRDQWDDKAVNNSHLVGTRGDVFVANYNTADRICKNDGAANYVCSETPDPFPHYSNSVALGDLDADGDLDAMVGVDVFANRRCLQSGGNLLCGDYGTIAASYDVALGTINSGSYPDVVVASGAGAFFCPDFMVCSALGTPAETYNSWGVGLGDMDGDGDLDAVFANYNQPNRVCHATGFPFGFSCANMGPDVRESRDVALGDLNGDGRVDAAFAATGGPNRFCLNNGGGSYTCSDVNVDALESLAVVIGDIDSDGDRDLVFAGTGEPNRKCVNNGSAVFTCSDVSADSGFFQGVSIGDLDGNGTRDLVFSRSLDTNLRCLNSGSGNFACANIEVNTGLSNDIAIGVGLPSLPTSTPTITQTPTFTPIP